MDKQTFANEHAKPKVNNLDHLLSFAREDLWSEFTDYGWGVLKATLLGGKGMSEAIQRPLGEFDDSLETVCLEFFGHMTEMWAEDKDQPLLWCSKPFDFYEGSQNNYTDFITHFGNCESFLRDVALACKPYYSDLKSALLEGESSL